MPSGKDTKPAKPQFDKLSTQTLLQIREQERQHTFSILDRIRDLALSIEPIHDRLAEIDKVLLERGMKIKMPYRRFDDPDYGKD